MTYLLIGVALTAYIFSFFLAVDLIFKGGLVRSISGWSLIAVLIAILAWAWEDTSNHGPCLRYETGTHYNPATRTMTPYRHCVERGEWIGE